MTTKYQIKLFLRYKHKAYALALELFDSYQNVLFVKLWGGYTEDTERSIILQTFSR